MYLHPADCNPPIITKADKDFTDNFDCKDLKFPEKTRDINKTEEKKNSIGIGAFGYKNKKKIFNPCFKNMLWRETFWFIIIYLKCQEKVNTLDSKIMK